jgi:hypothetical protein
MPTKANQIDLSALPPTSRREVRDFYQFLLERHSRKNNPQPPAKRSFADLCGQLSWKEDAVAAQRSIRDEW